MENNPENCNVDDIARMKKGRAPVGEDRHQIELHHKKQAPDGGVISMARTDYRLGDNYKKNHFLSYVDNNRR